MLAPDGDHDALPLVGDAMFRFLGGELAAADLWTTVDFAWMSPGAVFDRTAVGYRALPITLRTSGLTVVDQGAAPPGAQFLIEIFDDRLVAQAWWGGAALAPAPRDLADDTALQAWSAGSLSATLRVMRCEQGDIGLEAVLHIGARAPSAMLREFVTTFSWDVAALHAAVGGAPLCTTEEWVRRAALTVSRATPQIPLRAVGAGAGWRESSSPRGVFCNLQPGGGLAESDNVLYAVRGGDGALVPLATMPGDRREWGCARLVDVWLARDGETCVARSLVCEGFIRAAGGAWRRVCDEHITAVAPWGRHGFLLGLYDGRVAVVDGAQNVSPPRRVARVQGRFNRLVSVGDRAVGLIGSTLIGARLPIAGSPGRAVVDQWSLDLGPLVTCDLVCELDPDPWSETSRVAVLGDDALLIVRADTGVVQSRTPIVDARLAKWIGPNTLIVLVRTESGDVVRSTLQVLDTATGHWARPFDTAEVARLAVRGEEIHVGYADLSIAVWDRGAVSREAERRGAA